jgi:hypothetical protein
MDLDLEGTATQNTGYVLNESLVALNKAWCTETNALEILPFKNEIIQELQEQLEGQQVHKKLLINLVWNLSHLSSIPNSFLLLGKY